MSYAAVGEFRGWRLWVLQHLPWYDTAAVEQRHAHDAQLRRRAAAERDAWNRQLERIARDYERLHWRR